LKRKKSVSRCSAGVGSRERNEQGTKHYVTAVVTEAIAKGTDKFFDLTGGKALAGVVPESVRGSETSSEFADGRKSG